MSAAVTPSGVRDGDPAALAGLSAARGPSVLAYCRHVAGDADAAGAAADAFAAFRRSVVATPDASQLNPEALLVKATRTAAAERARPGGQGICAAVPGLLAARANKSITIADLERLEEHLETCWTCRAPVARFEAAERAYRDPPDPALEPAVAAQIVDALAAAVPPPEPEPEPPAVAATNGSGAGSVDQPTREFGVADVFRAGLAPFAPALDPAPVPPRPPEGAVAPEPGPEPEPVVAEPPPPAADPAPAWAQYRPQEPAALPDAPPPPALAVVPDGEPAAMQQHATQAEPSWVREEPGAFWGGREPPDAVPDPPPAEDPPWAAEAPARRREPSPGFVATLLGSLGLRGNGAGRAGGRFSRTREASGERGLPRADSEPSRPPRRGRGGGVTGRLPLPVILPVLLVLAAIVLALFMAGVIGGKPASSPRVSVPADAPTAPEPADVVVVPGASEASATEVERAKARDRARRERAAELEREAAETQPPAATATPPAAAPGAGSPAVAAPSAPSGDAGADPRTGGSRRIDAGGGATGAEQIPPAEDTSTVPELAPPAENATQP